MLDDVRLWENYEDWLGVGSTRDTQIQIVISVVFGIGAFLAFCILRPRWTGLYAARKQQRDEGGKLPDLPKSFWGWMPTLYRITDEQILASAGLDAYVFLRFFKMATRFLIIALFFALAVIKPVHDKYDPTDGGRQNKTESVGFREQTHALPIVYPYSDAHWSMTKKETYPTDYLWMYLVFVYLFTGFAMYLIVSETRKVIEVRQEYLGSQTTITDRTIRLSGIPVELRSEEKIKDFVEGLEIGKVESVTLCRNWKDLDQAMMERSNIVRRLEESWTVYQGHRRIERSLETLPVMQPPPPGSAIDSGADHESERLLPDSGADPSHVTPYGRTRPQTRLWYGRYRLRYKMVDAIDYYEEKLRRIDDKIRDLRKKEFEPTPLAFVTMDSVASCQMAVQAVLDPSPLQLQANSSPAPADVVWQNTYLPRWRRMTQAWTVTVIIALLTVFWSVILVPIATVLDVEKIAKIWPQLADLLESHDIALSLVQTQLTTLLVSLLNVLVPYLYWYLAGFQGMVSQGDVELSVISKNFFFTFINFFVVFTALGAAALSDWELLNKRSLQDATIQLARSITNLRRFYVNYIILQGVGLFPFRLLEFGSITLYPINLIGAKTPRDYAELVQPPLFSYGLYLPSAILIFMICIVYSILHSSWQVLLAGLAYYVIGYFCYKYQLLYAMDHGQHSTGRSWVMICDRVVIGLVVFQLTMAGQLALRGAVRRSIVVFPLLILTIWFSRVYSRSYKPLMKNIALRSIRGAEQDHDGGTLSPRYQAETRRRMTLDESRETGMRFVNPSTIAPLEDVWILDKSARNEMYAHSRAPSQAVEDNPWS